MAAGRQAMRDALVRRVPLFAARRLSPRPFVSLVYHLVSDAPLPHVAPLFDYKGTAAFEADLDWIRAHFSPVGHDEVAAHRLEGRRLPKNAVEITFDDGFAECHAVARSALLRRGIPATFHVIADCVDNAVLMWRHRIALCLSQLQALSQEGFVACAEKLRAELGLAGDSREGLRDLLAGLGPEDSPRIDAACAILGVEPAAFLRDRRPYLTSAEIRQLASEGFTIGAHSLSHPRLDRIPWQAARREVLESCARVRDLTGAKRVPFAIPFNGVALERERLAELRRADPSLSLVYDSNGLRRDRAFVVNRVNVDAPGAPGQSNLPQLLRDAHVYEALRERRRDAAPASAR